jgi:hypothetical protein
MVHIKSLIHIYESSVPVNTAWRVLGLRMEERPPAMEISYEYIKKAVADKR